MTLSSLINSCEPEINEIIDKTDYKLRSDGQNAEFFAATAQNVYTS